MTTIHNASLASGASSADLTVTPLEPHGVLAETDCLVQGKTITNDAYVTLARVSAFESVVIYPTTDTLRIQNIGPAAGVVELNAQ